MNKNFKQISRKALSVVVALMMVISCFAISLTVFAQSTAFVVPAASPAVPLVNGMGVELSDLSIEIGGEFVSGATLTWGDPVQGSSAVVIGTKLIGRDTGLTCFKVTDGKNTQNIWVFVNEEGNTDYSFVNSDFNNDSTYNLDDWIGSAETGNSAASPYIFGAYAIWPGGSQPSIVGGGQLVNNVATHVYHYDENMEAVDSKVLKVGGPNAFDGAFAAFYRNPALKDFGDYTIETKLASVVVSGTAGQSERRLGATGIIARAALSDDAYTIDGVNGTGEMALASDKNTLFLRIRNYGGLSIAGINATTKKGMDYTQVAKPYLGDDQAIMWHTAPATDGELYKGTSLDTSKVLLPTAQGGNAVETISDIKVELKGTGIKYTINDKVVFDTIAQNDLAGMFVPINDATPSDTATGYPSTLLVNEFPDTYTTSSMTHADYVTAYNTNLKADKGAVGISNQYGEITHISTFKVTPANVIGAALPTMVPVVVDKVFATTATSPAIPLYVGKSIAFNMLSIGFKDGTAIAGDKLTWERISGNAAKIVEGKLVGMFEGKAGFTVTDGQKTQTVWVIVNKQGNDKFALIDLDFSKEGAFKAEDWAVGKLVANPEDVFEKIGNARYGVIASGHYGLVADPEEAAKLFTYDSDKKALYMPAQGQYHVAAMAGYKSAMMNDFLDYSVEADMSIVMEREDEEAPLAAPGIITRLLLDDKAVNDGDYILDAHEKSLMFRFRNYGGVLMIAPNSSDAPTPRAGVDSTWETPYAGQEPVTCYYTLSDEITSDSVLRPGESLKKALVTYPDAKDSATLTTRNVKLALAGKDVAYTLDGHKILDTNDHSKTIGRFVLSGKNDGNWEYSCSGGQVAYSTYSGTFMNVNIHNAVGGSIGLVNNYGAGFYVYNISVIPKNILDAEALPAMKDAGDIQAVYQVPQNSKLDLSFIDEEVEWTDDNSNASYVVKDGMFIVLKGGRKATVKGTKNGDPYQVDINTAAAGADTDYPTVRFADNNMVITKGKTEGFVVSFSPTLEIVPGSLTVTEGEETKTIVDFAYDSTKKLVSYPFTADAAKMVLAVEFAQLGDMAKNIYNLGVTIPSDTSKKALRFSFEIPAIRISPNNELVLDSTTFVVENKEITLLNVGALILPKAFLGSKSLVIPTGAEFDATSDTAIAWVNGHQAKNIPITVLSSATSKFSIANVRLDYTDGEKDVTLYDADIASVVYIQYIDDEGNIGYLYGDTIADSYQAIYDKWFPAE